MFPEGNAVYTRNNFCYTVIIHHIPEEFKATCNTAHTMTKRDCYFLKNKSERGNEGRGKMRYGR